MPKRFIAYSKQEPARTILFSVSILSLIMQGMAMGLHYALPALLNFGIVAGICGYGIWAAHKASVKHMPIASFWQFLIWLWSGLTRALFSPDWMLLLWFPMLVVAVVMAVVYINLSHQKKMGF